MNSLEFINQNIFECKNHIKHLETQIIEDKKYPSFVKSHKERIEELNPILKQLLQIKAELESWKFVKEEVGFTIENIEGSRSSNVYGCKYGLKCYGEGIIPLSDKEVKSFKKALEVEKCEK